MTIQEKFKENILYYNINNLLLNDDVIINLFFHNDRLVKNSINHVSLFKNINTYLLNRFSETNNIEEILYRIKNSITDIPTCECGNYNKFRSINFGYTLFCCSHCARISLKTKLKKEHTVLQKYGNKTYNNTEKRKQTCIEKYGVDNPMKSPDVLKKYKNTCIEKYGVENVAKDILVLKKKENTCLLHYGVKNVFLSNIIKTKIQNTNMLKYGVNYVMLNKDILDKAKTTFLLHIDIINEKRKNTCLSRYGVDNCSKLDTTKNKISLTCLKLYGVKYPALIQGIQNKIICTCLKKYGQTHYTKTEKYKQWASLFISSDIIQTKINNTKRKNKSFNTSKIEAMLLKYFEGQNIKFKYLYKSWQYPYNCDFYLIDFDLYIEIQGNWTHGPHPFNENDENDIKLLNKWKSKLSKYYNDAINVWTNTDVKKREIAKSNNLKFIEIFSTNLDVCLKEINKYLYGDNITKI